MNIQAETLNHPLCVMLHIASDHLDAGNVNTFKQLIQPHLDVNDTVLIDMSALEFVDSSGLGSLLSCLRTMNNKGGKLKLVGMTKPVHSLFELVRMNRIFSIYNTKEAALEAL